MEFIRYINGIKISKDELKGYKFITPELETAVRDAGQRMSMNTAEEIQNGGEVLYGKTEG